MKTKNKQRYKYFFFDRFTKKLQYATVAYSFIQAVKQLEEKHPHDEIKYKVENHSFDYSREPYIPKEQPAKPKTQDKYKQLGFKGFVNS